MAYRFVGIAALAWLTTSDATAGPLVVDVLDIGQGDAILIRTPEKTALIDTGPKSARTGNQLRELGVYRLDLVVATHPHADHIGRMPNIVRDFDVGLYMDNGMPHTTSIYTSTMALVEDKQISYKTARTGQRLNFGEDVYFDVLFPGDEQLGDTRSDWNSNSVVMSLVHGEMSMLFTGDSEEPTERALLEAGLGEHDLLKVAHHGSRHSTSEAFLEAVKPQIALISCGLDNKFGHPGEETLERLAAQGVEVYRTDESGNLRVISDGAELSVVVGPISRVGSGLIELGLADEVVIEGPVPIPRGASAPLELDEKERRRAAKREEKRRRQAEKARKKGKWPLEGEAK